MPRVLKRSLFLLPFLLPGLCSAQEAVPQPAGGDTFNPALFTLIGLAVILVFINGVLANVLRQLAQACTEKIRAERRSMVSGKSLLLLLTLSLSAVWAQAQETAEAAAGNTPALISGIPADQFYFLVLLNGFLLLILLVLSALVRMLTRELRGIPAKAHIPRRIFKRNFLDLLNKSVDVNQESDILMDHDYDGIRELDNDLPPWWKWGFVLTIISAAIYMGYYHMAGGPGQVEEYRMAMARAEEEQRIYLANAANNVDEHSVTLVTDAGELAGAEAIFQTACAACHAKDGGGGVGPNLTDKFWMHGGGLKEIFKSIKYGWPDKGMKSWKDDYSPKQIAALASYIENLKGSSPAVPKAPQGEPEQTAAPDSSTAAAVPVPAADPSSSGTL